MAWPVTLALDWTPNTNHTGFYVARAKGFYTDAGVDVTIRSPHVDNYERTNPSLLADGTATFAIAPSESVISYHTWPGGAKPKLMGVAAVLQDSTSAIVTLKSSGIDRPAKLDGKVYASYGARYEGRIVQQLIRNDGGKGDFQETVPNMLGIWKTILKGKADATWVFMGWEGVDAEMKGVELNVFKLEDYRIPYGYGPLLLAHPDTLRDHAGEVKAFLSATAKGFQYAAAHPDEAADILYDEVAKDAVNCPLPEPLRKDMLQKAQAYCSQHYLNAAGQWGQMKMEVWDGFLDFLSDNGLLTTKVQSRKPTGTESTSLDGLRQGDVGERIDRSSLKAEELFTNDFLPAAADS